MSRRNIALLAIFIGPIASAADQLLCYVLANRAATHGGESAMVVLTAVAAAVILLGLTLAWRVLRSCNARPGDEGVGGVDPFLAVVGIAMNLLFLWVVVVGFGLPQWFLGTTD